jgi:hypothetical protein
MISHKYKCIFVHIPKVAGQSIEMFFLDLHKLDWDSRSPLLLRPNDNPELGPPRLAHLKLHEYTSYDYLSPDRFDEYFKFTFVRNPWSRTVSFYKFEGYNEIMSFKQFVRKKLPELVNEKNWFYAPQYDFIYHEERTKIDFIGRFEDLHNDFSTICKKLKVPFTKLPHHNKSEIGKVRGKLPKQIKSLINDPARLPFDGRDEINSTDYKDYYDSSLIRAVEDLYHIDIDKFNYDFEAF